MAAIASPPPTDAAGDNKNNYYGLPQSTTRSSSQGMGSGISFYCNKLVLLAGRSFWSICSQRVSQNGTAFIGFCPHLLNYFHPFGHYVEQQPLLSSYYYPVVPSMSSASSFSTGVGNPCRPL